MSDIKDACVKKKGENIALIFDAFIRGVAVLELMSSSIYLTL